ncbi:uncharacterized protein FOMMEDRAFT_23338 [Fomitiporia mediterranea MF3/22]|uniref:uncharacterized protein n=1 Tax=Fomitiporia mediterranea (strain MF3/22) TaxID=694068 RepID=UPI000440942E|nr:uncharacterized protein FOMMEDRAFT_23338 [Fomitiporia mediterranea MF3/22]EJC98979.1 hypothetical protein FOMMEDRAFT_23338 [Fomitiporia mediterranea MF3/22]
MHPRLPVSLSLQLFLLALCMPSSSSLDIPIHPSGHSRRANVPSTGYFDPRNNGGSFLTKIPQTFPEGLGEPLNVILSANSDAAVLVDSEDHGGLQNYFISLGFAGECLGQHSGSDQMANLGDGDGYLNETAVIRWAYGDPTLGTCQETIKGGNHFRYWVQDGKEADSKAVFMALSYEKPIAEQHDIIDNGYNLGRDWLIGNATNAFIPTSNLTNSSTYTGSTSANGYMYQTSVQYVSGLLSNTSDGINHFQSMTTNAVDGLVAVMTVHITQAPQQATSSSALQSLTLPTPISAILLPFLLYVLFFTRSSSL